MFISWGAGGITLCRCLFSTHLRKSSLNLANDMSSRYQSNRIELASYSVRIASHADVLRGSSCVSFPTNVCLFEQLLPFVDCGPISSRFPTLGELVFVIKNITWDKMADLNSVFGHVCETFGIRELNAYQREAIV